MSSTAMSKATVAIAIVLSIGAMTIVVLGEPTIPMATRLVDCWRVFVMVQLGIFLGLLALCGYSLSKVKIDINDKLLRLLGGWALSSALLAVFAFLVTVHLFRTVGLTWITPFLFGTLCIGDWCGFYLLVRIRRILRLAKNATIKLTLIDTHLPGPDIDLDNGHRVLHG